MISFNEIKEIIDSSISVFALFGIDDAAAAVIVSALVSAAAAGIGNAINSRNTRETNTANKEINDKNLDFQAAQTQAAWERDDTAYQRQVADLEKAGLSPLAATSGGSQTTAPLGAPSVLPMQAPQVDVNSLVQSLLGSSQLMEENRHNKAIEDYRSGLLENQAQEILISSRRLDIENKKVEADIRYQADLIKLDSERLDEIIRSNKKNEEIKLSESETKRLQYESERFYQEVDKQTGGKHIPYMRYDDFRIYYDAKKLWNVSFQHFVEKLGATKTSKGESKSQNFGAGAGFNGQVPTPGYLGVGVNGNFNEGTSNSTFDSKDLSKQQEADLMAFYHDNPVPVFYPK